MVTRRVHVRGLVQGVFFRAWARDEAAALGIKGWIRNCRDGSVEAHIEGNEDAVRQMVERLRQGPPDARVDDLEIDVAEPEGIGSFEVRH